MCFLSGRSSYFVSMNSCNILIWNVRGLNKHVRHDVVSEVVFSSRAGIVCLQETKVASISSRLLLSVLGTEFDRHVALPTVGTRGSIFIAWKGAVCQALGSRVDSYSTFVQFAHQDGHLWWFTGVYDP